MKLCGLPWPLLLACSSAHLRGADSVAREKEPRIDARATLLPTDCRDERGAPVPSPDLEVAYFAPRNGPRQLLERRTDYDSVLVENSYEEQGTLVFAYVSSDSKHPDLLHRVQLGPDAAHGELSVSRTFKLTDTSKGFRADPVRSALRCTLAPLRARE